ncbi:cell wall-binding repeat-containing protein [Euzebya pacifica]|uniref:cell wall-binding repeat-containing protein n=1 Tax=Euzebya pacifica TaxID=1608957 RepID=UPI001C1FF915|nr:cell wall-binding repeat-containing protein [Euzebya pacifica]
MLGETSSRRARWAPVITVMAMVCSLLAAPASAQESADPTEPDRPASSFAAYPGPSVSLSGISFDAVPVDRVAGATRYGTAVEASQRGWPEGARHVIVAPGETWNEALPAASLAGVLRAPMLLAGPAGLDADTVAELERLAPETITVVGTLPDSVADAANEVADEVTTIVAQDVHATSAALARAADEAGAADTLIVASALSFADSLSASALATGLRMPLVLVGTEGFDGWVRDQRDALDADDVIVIGGEAVVPDAVVAQVDNVTRLAGSNRYGTALAVANHLRASGLDGPPVVASGTTFADGLTGGVLAGISNRAPLLLTDPMSIPDEVAQWLAADGTEWVRVMGGDAAVSTVVQCQLGQGNTRSFYCVEEELTRMGYHVGPVDGQPDAQTVWMTFAMQSVNGMANTGDFGEAEFLAMLDRAWLEPRRPDLEPDHMEIDIGRQLVLVVRDGRVQHVVHTSTGKSSTPTVIGTWRVYEMRNYRQTRNNMYRPVFFHRGYAFHGYPSVPTYAASAGCARVYDGDMDFLWEFLYIGEQVTTYH